MSTTTASATLMSMLLLCRMMRDVQSSLNKSEIPHSRQKRIIWITHDGRLAFPPGTKIDISSSISFPFVRDPPDSLSTSVSCRISFTIDMDKLGLTDDENPYGHWVNIFEKSLGRASGALMGSYINKYIKKKRGKRTLDLPKEVEKYFDNKFHGGERALLYIYVENLMRTFGIAGKQCLLRTICEVNANPLTNHGFFGEVLHLFLKPSYSEHSHLLNEYVEAEMLGKHDGECFRYFKDCPVSLFKQRNIYLKKYASFWNRSSIIEPVNIELFNNEVM